VGRNQAERQLEQERQQLLVQLLHFFYLQQIMAFSVLGNPPSLISQLNNLSQTGLVVCPHRIYHRLLMKATLHLLS